MTVKDCIKNKKLFAKNNKMSRTTLYKMFDLYDAEEYDKIPKRIFDLLRAAENDEDEGNVPLEIELSRKGEGILLTIDDLQKKIRIKEKEYEDIIPKPKENGFCDIEDVLNPRLKEVEIEINDLYVQINDLTLEYDSIMKEKAKLSNSTYIKTERIGSGEIDTCPFFDGKKYMITWNVDRHDDRFRLCLFVRLNGGYYHLKDYYPKEGENFVIIDDVVFDAPLFYYIDEIWERDGVEECGALTMMSRLRPIENDA